MNAPGGVGGHVGATHPHKRVLLVAFTLQPPGGAMAIGSWMIEALKRACALTVLTWTPLDVAPINRYFGTRIAPQDVVACGPPAALRRALDALPGGLVLLKMAVLVATARRMAPGFDVLVSAEGEIDFGRPAIAYVNLPGNYQWRGLPYPPARRGRRLALAAYRALVDRVAPVSVERLRANLTLLNSDWSSARYRDARGAAGVTLFPPVAGDFEAVPWQEREAAFVCIGRMAPDKRLDEAIGVVAAVRAHGKDVRLHLVSPRGGEPATRATVLARLEAARAWATLHEDLSRAELARLVSRCRYGIHAAAGEPFGMAVGEMVRGGCIPWVPREGGVAEIVGRDERLLWEKPAEAVAKITRVVGDPVAEVALRTALAGCARGLGVEAFAERVRALVAGFPAA